MFDYPSASVSSHKQSIIPKDNPNFVNSSNREPLNDNNLTHIPLEQIY